jgi:hypothetical protein
MTDYMEAMYVIIIYLLAAVVIISTSIAIWLYRFVRNELNRDAEKIIMLKILIDEIIQNSEKER